MVRLLQQAPEPWNGRKKCRVFNPLRMKLYLSDLKAQFVPRSKNSYSVIKTDELLLYREKKIAVCSEIHAKHIHALWAEHRISEC
jgi:hypothetical protein